MTRLDVCRSVDQESVHWKWTKHTLRGIHRVPISAPVAAHQPSSRVLIEANSVFTDRNAGARQGKRGEFW